ncbi:MAG TPA: AAA family ATPase [Sedimentisphaerales bacterium]|nr:AAA family ATPase [Sedimentisphaerales bacterium]
MPTAEINPRLRWALLFAERGWPVFPVAENAKKPPLLSSWETKASASRAQILQWASRWPNCNWGLAAGRAGLIVVDAETPAAAIPYDQQTLAIRTPRGGVHMYYAGRGASLVRPVPDVDTRSIGGYVMLPGCTTSDGEYSVLRDLEVKVAPDIVVQLATKATPAVIESVAPDLVIDQGTASSRAHEYLRTTEPAISGLGGNHRTYQAAVQVRDFGLSEDLALQAMLDVYNPRCTPPWSEEELAKLVKNAYTYAQTSAPGAASPEHDFSAAATAQLQSRSAGDINFNRIPPRDWILEHRYVGRYITVIVSPGGIGKSSLTLLDAVSVVTGQELSGATVKRTGNVWLHNAEDPDHELDMRTAALCIHHKIPIKKLAGLRLTSGRTMPLCLAREVQGRARLDSACIAAITEHIRAHKIILWIVDPFVQMHAVDENDNQAMALVMGGLSKIAEETGCGICLVHHTRKGRGSEDGDADISRGASAIISAARLAYSLRGMSPEEAKKNGIREEDRRWLMRLDSAKLNLAPPAERALWWRRVSVPLPCGESVGSLEPLDFSAVQGNYDVESRDLMSILAQVLEPGGGTGLNEFCERLTVDGRFSHLYGHSHPKSIATALRRALAAPREWHGRKYSLVQIPGRGRTGKNWMLFCSEGRIKNERDPESPSKYVRQLGDPELSKKVLQTLSPEELSGLVGDKSEGNSGAGSVEAESGDVSYLD